MHELPKGLIFAIYYPVLAAIGLPANLAVVAILSQNSCGLSRCITYYLVSMAVTDLLVMITAVILNRIVGIYSPSSFLSITPVCSFRTAVNMAVIDNSAWLTIAFTFDRFVAISCQNLKATYCTKKVAAWVIGVVSTLCCMKNSFLYFVLEPRYEINSIPWFCSIKEIYYTSSAWAAYDWIRSILNPCLPFILILLLNVLTIRRILSANRARRRLQLQSNGENQCDPEVEKRRKSIILLFSISGTFILLYLLFFLNILYVRAANITYSSGSTSRYSMFYLEQTGYMLQLLSSCINPFIYAVTQSKIRDELKHGVRFALNILINIFKY
ncbi:probable G-protein coupled receptor 139 [Hemiscyllium ocellatum]|uniref:probable G-protein coupled receptor 139 n=1 Tax=Hemiscyllium ocellatum TaxID=170820 RepID=UPI00296655D4|nr:probable G-protein coupled receptor 139 [Hemiscyllium ocellatum]